MFMAKEVFVLIRKLFEGPAPHFWKNNIRSMLDAAFGTASDLLRDIKAKIERRSSSTFDISITSDASEIKKIISAEQAEQLRRLLAAFTIVNGFTYIPSPNDRVKVLANGIWENAVVISCEEHQHMMKVQLIKKNGKVNSQ